MESYGIICLHMGKILLIRRRNSYALTDLVRHIKTVTMDDIVYYAAHMTIPERDALKVETFDQVWKRTWYNPRYRTGRDKTLCRVAYNGLVDEIRYSIDNTVDAYPEAEWGLPKGRPDDNEEPLETALREFTEETRIPPGDIQVLPVKFRERYHGHTGKVYDSVYFIAVYIGDDPQDVEFDDNVEVDRVSWVPVEDAEGYIRKYYHGKRAILRKLARLLGPGENYS